MKLTMRWLLPLITILGTTVLTYGAQPSMLCKSPGLEFDNTLFTVNTILEKDHQHLPAFEALRSALENGEDLIPCDTVFGGLNAARNHFSTRSLDITKRLDAYQQKLTADAILYNGVSTFQNDIECTIQQLSGTRGSTEENNNQLINGLINALNYLDTIKGQTSIISLETKRGGGGSCCQCQRGPRGLPGDPGPQGVRGPTGTSGSSGPTGFSGITGVTGTTGAQGEPGFSTGQIYYLQHTQSVPDTFEQLLTNPDPDPEATECQTVDSSSLPDGVLIDQYLTDPGVPGITVIPAGTWTFRTYASVDVQNVGDVSEITTYAYVYHADDTETPLFNFTTQITATTATLYQTEFTYNVETDIAVTDRIGVRYFAKTNVDPDDSRIICIYHSGNLHPTNLITPLPVFGNVGASGVTGQTGTTGATGFSGATGLSGITGFSGSTGKTGLTGQTGITGLSGQTGFSGLSGSTGLSGTTGQSGTTGFTGATGASGNTGYSGLTGQSGLTGLSGLTGATGFSGNTGTSGLTGFSGGTGFSGATGKTGLTGQSGATGLSGISGQTGVTGTTGQSGATGLSGITGFSGATGSSGTTGISGLTGYTGATGQSGITGFTGTTGQSGTTGLSGSTGFSGATGLSGSTGLSGTTGLSGITGRTGATGLTGFSGITGTTGLSTTGVTGATGSFATGTTGATGSSSGATSTGFLFAYNATPATSGGVGTLDQTLLTTNTSFSGTPVIAAFPVVAQNPSGWTVSTTGGVGTSATTFTCPLSGTYLINWRINAAPASSGNELNGRLVISALGVGAFTEVAGSLIHVDLSQGNADTELIGMSIVSLTATDQLRVQLIQSDTGGSNPRVTIEAPASATGATTLSGPQFTAIKIS